MLGAMRDTKTHRPRTMNKEFIRRLLLPYQIRWVSDPAGLKVIEKARRVGISWTEAYDAVMHAGWNKAAATSTTRPTTWR